VTNHEAHPISDRQLVSQWVTQHDESAARELMERLHPRVNAIIRRPCSREEDWDDLEQETFVRIFRNLDGYQPDKPLEHWVSRITLNVCREFWRKKSRRPEHRWSDLGEGEQRAFALALQTGQPLEELSALDAKDLLLRLFETLNEKDRLVLSLLHLEDRSIAEISDLTGMRVSAIKVRAHRARKKLQTVWARLENEARQKRSK
jgi:RNA polymerase sigma-70 factor (ECF subfamily)